MWSRLDPTQENEVWDLFFFSNIIHFEERKKPGSETVKRVVVVVYHVTIVAISAHTCIVLCMVIGCVLRAAGIVLLFEAPLSILR